MKCIKSTYELFKPGRDYDLKEIGTAGRYTVYQYVDEQGWIYTFGLDEAGSNETDGNFMQFSK